MGSSLLMDAVSQGAIGGLTWLCTAWLSLECYATEWFTQVQPILAETSFLEGLVSKLWVGFQVALGLGFVVFVHELGHFLAAKTFGVRCDKFYVGFDVPISIGPIKFPRTLGKFQWGETEYGIGIIPLGGYVKMLGQDDDPRKAEEEAARIRDGEGEEAPLDPRSYPAKPVWQRMIIISAGVVMNLIFAVILAGVAYQVGVPYTPTVVGALTGGGPAWQQGLQTGDQILRVGSMEEQNENLRFNDFLTTVAMRSFDKRDEQVTLTVGRDGDQLDYTLTPMNNLHPNKKLYFVGVSSPPAAELSDVYSVYPWSHLSDLDLDLESGDRIVAVNGQTLPVDPRFDQPLGSTLRERLQADWDQAVTITVERQREKSESPEQIDVEVPPAPVKWLGLGFKPGPITAFRQGSSAKAAGMQVGDIITHLNGEPVTNSWKLPTMVARAAGEKVKIKVLRPGGSQSTEDDAPAAEQDVAAGSQLDFEIQVDSDPKFALISPFGGRLTLPGIGVAFKSSAEVSEVDVEPGDQDSQILPGDELVQIVWEPDKAMTEKLTEYRFDVARASEPRQIDSLLTIDSMWEEIQQTPLGLKVRCFFRRDGQTRETVLTVKQAEDWFFAWDYRGLALGSLQQTHYASSFTEALALGAVETWKRFTEVLSFLKILITGKAGTEGFGGPVKIFQAAGSEASYGVSRLLLFLTLLSANLAILNFLPIPALDGGHMVFLTAEAIRGKPVNEALQIRLTMAGVLCLLCLMGFVIVKDLIDLM